MTEKNYVRAQVATFLVLAILFAIPHVLHALRTEGQGRILMRSTDDGLYQARYRAVLLGRLSEVTNGMTGGHPPARGASPALLEFLTALPFRMTHLKAPHVTVLLTLLVTPLIVFLLSALFRGITGSRSLAILGTLLYVAAFFSPLQKPVHVSLTLPVTIGILLLCHKIYSKPSPLLAAVTGFLVGLLTLVYFWSFTYVWAILGWLTLLHFFCAPTPEQKRTRTSALLVLLGAMIVAAIPWLWSMLHTAWYDPTFTETAYRSTVLHTRAVESLPRSALLALLVTLCLALARTAPHSKSDSDEEWLFPVAMLLGSFTALHQNFLHGIILSFSAHYYPFVTLSVLAVGLWALRNFGASMLGIVTVGIASIFLLAALWDYRIISLNVLRGTGILAHLDHLRPVLKQLDDGERQVILTDRTTAHAVTSWTDDDVIFTAYARHLLMSDREYAERFCLSELPKPSGPDFVWLAREVVEHPEQEELRKREEQFRTACAFVLTYPREALKQYDVEAALWNEKASPEWHMDPMLFEKVQQGNGWSLWKIRSQEGLTINLGKNRI